MAQLLLQATKPLAVLVLRCSLHLNYMRNGATAMRFLSASFGVLACAVAEAVTL
ncbi:hypothetical protein [Shewanella dokdonensis]|uniref:hypothetical protein n=1 Tax=Shewanella dokdonensis TaxID=712036 RepID=UPI001FD1664B|nr:hypothetical protein [Shewanella dokdonensis]